MTTSLAHGDTNHLCKFIRHLLSPVVYKLNEDGHSHTHRYTHTLTLIQYHTHIDKHEHIHTLTHTETHILINS